jgi:hypothetical protein
MILNTEVQNLRGRADEEFLKKFLMRLISRFCRVPKPGEGKYGVSQEVEPGGEVRDCEIRFCARRLWLDADTTGDVLIVHVDCVMDRVMKVLTTVRLVMVSFPSTQ